MTDIAKDPAEARKLRYREGCSKANAEYQKVSTAVLTLAVALIAVPLLFFKEIFKENLPTGGNLGSIILKQGWPVLTAGIVAYLSLMGAVFCALKYTAWSGFFLQKLYLKHDPILYFDENKEIDDHGQTVKTVEPKKILTRLGRFFWGSVCLLATGLLAMMLFVLLYTRVSTDPPSSQPGAQGGTTQQGK